MRSGSFAIRGNSRAGSSSSCSGAGTSGSKSGATLVCVLALRPAFILTVETIGRATRRRWSLAHPWRQPEASGFSRVRRGGRSFSCLSTASYARQAARGISYLAGTHPLTSRNTTQAGLCWGTVTDRRSPQVPVSSTTSLDSEREGVRAVPTSSSRARTAAGTPPPEPRRGAGADDALSSCRRRAYGPTPTTERPGPRSSSRSASRCWRKAGSTSAASGGTGSLTRVAGLIQRPFLCTR